MAIAQPFLAALAGHRQTPPPFWLMRQAGRYLPEYRALRARAGSFLALCHDPELAVEVTLQPLRRFDMDAAILFADILLVPQALGQPLDFREGEGPVLEPVRERAALAGLEVARVVERLAPVLETVRAVRAALAPEKALIGFAGAPWTVACYMVEGGGSRDFIEVKRWAFGDPEGFAQLIDLLVEATAAYLTAQARAGADALQLFDTWAGVLPEPHFRRWCIEPTARLVARLRAAGVTVPLIGFPRGAGPGVADYARDTGVDGLGLDTALPARWAVREIPAGVTLQGNLDPVVLLAGGAALDDEVRRIVRTLGERPFVFNLGHGVLPPTPPEHVARLAELVREGGA